MEKSSEVVEFNFLNAQVEQNEDTTKPESLQISSKKGFQKNQRNFF